MYKENVIAHSELDPIKFLTFVFLYLYFLFVFY